MSAVHCVVVWEWQNVVEGQWVPHAPNVARTLERAYAKKLTRVVLADADPSLRGHYVNLRTLTQYADTPEGGSEECAVRRASYSLQSAAARGVCWEWARLHHHALHYEPMPMEAQCIIEEAWRTGTDSVSWEGWSISVSRQCARRGGCARALRRGGAPPYPLARPPAHEPVSGPPTPPARTPVEGRRPRIPQQHTGSSVHSVQSMHSMQSAHSVQSAQSVQSAPAGARSVSPRERKPGLARQILHNLNIFSSNKPVQDKCRVECESYSGGGGGGGSADREGSTPEGSTRRHSVDTVSTYLSHESKDSLQQASVGSLLNCSAGSDEVFEGEGDGDGGSGEGAVSPAAPAYLTTLCDDDDDGDLIVGCDEESAVVSAWVRLVRCVQWGALCSVCVRALAGGSEGSLGAVVALVRCHHLLHLRCLNDQMHALRRNNLPLRIECRVCGLSYGCVGGGSQPAGSMAWRLQPQPLPHHHEPTILVTYNFQSGIQGPQHPLPGAPYYAVGFPRYTVLPDNQLGRQVLCALRAAWSSARLFSVSASQTTGREHVVSWATAPPPPRAALYRAAPNHHARLLTAALRRIHALLRADL